MVKVFHWPDIMLYLVKKSLYITRHVNKNKIILSLGNLYTMQFSILNFLIFTVCLRVDQLWICIECRQILCGRNALGHGTAHYEFHKNHCIFLNIESAAIFW